MNTRNLLIALAAALALVLGIYLWLSQPVSGQFASVDPGTFDLKSHQGKRLRGYLYRGDASAHEMLVTQRTGNYGLPMNGDLWKTIDATVTEPGTGGTSCLSYATECSSLATRLFLKTGRTARCDHVNAPLTNTCTNAPSGTPSVLGAQEYEVREDGKADVVGYLCVASDGQEAWLTKESATPPYAQLQLTPKDLTDVADCICDGGTGKSAKEFFDVATKELGLNKSEVTELHGDVTFETSCRDIETVNALFETLDQADDGEIPPGDVLGTLDEVRGGLEVNVEPLLGWVRGELEAASEPDGPAARADAPEKVIGASIDDGTWQIWVGGDLKGFALRFDDGSLELMAVKGAMPLVADQIDFLKIEGNQSYSGDELSDLQGWWARLAGEQDVTASDYSVLVVRDEKLRLKTENCPTEEKPRLAIGAGTYEVRNLERTNPGQFEIGYLRGLYLSSGSDAEGQELYHLKWGINLPLKANNDGFSLVKSNDLPDLDSFSCDPNDDRYFETVADVLDDAYTAPFGDRGWFMKRAQVSYTPYTTP